MYYTYVHTYEHIHHSKAYRGVQSTMTDIHASIVAVIEDLVSEGKKPTNQAIRDRLGSGSFTTISKVRRAWEAKNPQNTASPAVVEVPEKLQALLDRVGVECVKWQSETTTKQIETIQAGAEERVTAAESERDEYESEVGRLEAEVERLKPFEEQYHQIDKELAIIRAHLETQTTKAKQAMEQMESYRKECDDRNKLIGQLEGELKALKEGKTVATPAPQRKK